MIIKLFGKSSLKLNILLVIFSFFCTGCATLYTTGPFITREMEGNYNLPAVYKTTVLDCIWFGEAEFPQAIILYPALTIDLPFSITVDTVFLPLDTLRYFIKETREQPLLKSPTQSEPEYDKNGYIR